MIYVLWVNLYFGFDLHPVVESAFTRVFFGAGIVGTMLASVAFLHGTIWQRSVSLVLLVPLLSAIVFVVINLWL